MGIKSILGLAALLLFVAVFGALFMKPAQPAISHADVVLTARGFVPQEVTISRHGTVTFSSNTGKPFWPASNPHPVHSIYPTFDPHQPIPPNETWTFQFDQAGDWNFHDHMRSEFLGTIHVI